MAVACLLLATLLGVVNILQFRHKEFILGGELMWLRSSNNYMAGDPGIGRLRPVPPEIKALVRKFKAPEIEAELARPHNDPLATLRRINQILQENISALMGQLGQSGEVTQPQSAFVASHLVLGVLEQNTDEWRPSLRKVDATYQQGNRSNRPESVKVSLDVTFFADDVIAATGHYEGFRNALLAHDWCLGVDERKTSELTEGDGIHVQGLPVTVDVAKYYAALERGLDQAGAQ